MRSNRRYQQGQAAPELYTEAVNECREQPMMTMTSIAARHGIKTEALNDFLRRWHPDILAFRRQVRRDNAIAARERRKARTEARRRQQEMKAGQRCNSKVTIGDREVRYALWLKYSDAAADYCHTAESMRSIARRYELPLMGLLRYLYSYHPQAVAERAARRIGKNRAGTQGAKEEK